MQQKWWSCDENYNQMYNAILLTNENGTKCGLQNKDSAKISLQAIIIFEIFLFPESWAASAHCERDRRPTSRGAPLGGKGEMIFGHTLTS